MRVFEIYYLMDSAGRFMCNGAKYDKRVKSTYLHNEARPFETREQAEANKSGRFQTVHKMQFEK